MKAFSNTEHVWLQWVPAFPSLAANCILTVFLHCLSFALFCEPNPTGIKMIIYVYETEHIERTVLSAHPGALKSIFAHCFWVTKKKIFKGSNAYRDGKSLNRKIGSKVKRLAPTPYSPESSAKASQRQFFCFMFLDITGLYSVLSSGKREGILARNAWLGHAFSVSCLPVHEARAGHDEAAMTWTRWSNGNCDVIYK